jgi:hypothetical protein
MRKILQLNKGVLKVCKESTTDHAFYDVWIVEVSEVFIVRGLVCQLEEGIEEQLEDSKQ